MNISIIGCKFFNDYQVLKWQLDELNLTRITTCGEGEIDKLAARYAGENNIELIDLWPGQQMGWINLWKEYYKLVVSSDVLLAFWYGETNSVLSMVNKAKSMKKEVIVIYGYHPDPSKTPLPISVLKDQSTAIPPVTIQSQAMDRVKLPLQFQNSQQTQPTYKSVKE